MQVGTSLRGKEEIPILLVLGACSLAAATAARALLALAESGHPFPFHCPFRMLTGLPCPAEVVVDRLCAGEESGNRLLVTLRRVQGRIRRHLQSFVR